MSFMYIYFLYIFLKREHCKLDWHRYNMKQKYFQKPTVTEDEVEEQISGEYIINITFVEHKALYQCVALYKISTAKKLYIILG